MKTSIRPARTAITFLAHLFRELDELAMSEHRKARGQARSAGSGEQQVAGETTVEGEIGARRLGGWKPEMQTGRVGHGGFRSGQAGPWPRRASLEVRLVVTALCLLAAAAAVITGACGLMAWGYLHGQADQQLRAYAARLMSHPFKASPLYGVAADVPGPGGPGIEVREPAGQVVLRAGPAGRAGPAIPAVPAAVPAHRDQPATLAGGGGNWRVITEPIHYRARRIPFSYSAEGFYLVITGTTRRGLPGTLVIGLDLQGARHAIGRLVFTVLAISGAVLLAVACLAVALSRALLRPVTQAERTLTAAAAGQLSCRVPERHGGDAGRLAVSLNTMLGQIERAFQRRAASEQAARRSRGQLRRDIADVGDQLRKPLSIVRGIAEAYRRGGRVSADEVDRMMRRVADESARMAALADALPQSGGLGRRD